MTQNTKKKVLICGATGFIGRNIVEHFATLSDFEVYGTYWQAEPLENPNIRMVEADLTNKDDVARVVEGKDIIIQAAATTSGAKDIVEKPYYHVTDNALMNSLLLRAAFEHNVAHFIFFSCTVMYQPSDTALSEQDFDANQELLPKYFGVGWTKVYIEKMCEFYSRIGNTKYTVIRHSNIYGPHDKYDLEKSHVFGATLTKVMTAPPNGQIVVWGEGTEARDLLHVADLVDFVEAAIAKQESKFKLYAVGLGEAISVADLVKKMIEHSGKNLTISYDTSKPSIKTSLFLDCSRAKEELGWAPKISLDEGIERTMAWYKEHYDHQ
ncbi:MAG: NAD(P)-dependent oxidoreductase [Candidatus Wildermuthbacteria bacterium]|nr:NAD(P)-dependent oxidoreductase [Candidatus Wildermuthbacteria bacterium]